MTCAGTVAVTRAIGRRFESTLPRAPLGSMRAVCYVPPTVSTRRKLAWISLLYFAQGFPFGIVVDNLPVYFRAHGVSLTEIGLLQVLGMPWTLKVFWAPLVDRFGSRARVITGALGVLAAATAAIPIFDPATLAPALVATL